MVAADGVGQENALNRSCAKPAAHGYWLFSRDASMKKSVK